MACTAHHNSTRRSPEGKKVKFWGGPSLLLRVFRLFLPSSGCFHLFSGLLLRCSRDAAGGGRRTRTTSNAKFCLGFILRISNASPGPKLGEHPRTMTEKEGETPRRRPEKEHQKKAIITGFWVVWRRSGPANAWVRIPPQGRERANSMGTGVTVLE